MQKFRTVLEQQIRERRMTFEEFAAYAEQFAREHDEPGTLSVRHLQRLAAGRRSEGRPLGPVQPTTARLLEHIFGMSINELLAPPSLTNPVDDHSAELRQLLAMSGRIDASVIAEFQRQFASIRRLDRELGAIFAHEEVLAKINQLAGLLTYSMSGKARGQISGLLSELCCLAGWQALDLGKLVTSWQLYDRAGIVALESSNLAFKALADAGRAFVLIDAGETESAVHLVAAARESADGECSNILQSWFAAAHGEVLASDGRLSESLREFDKAAVTLPPSSVTESCEPYVELDQIHLARWRGGAMTKSAGTSSVEVLTNALNQLDSTFTRAETALRVDLATAFLTLNEPDQAREQAKQAQRLATKIGSVRQQRRIHALGILHD